MKVLSKFAQFWKLSSKLLAILIWGLLCCFDHGIQARAVAVSGGLEDDVGSADFDDLNDDEAPVTCWGLEFSEVYTYYPTGEAKSNQFIELVNTSDETVSLAGCVIEYYLAYAKDLEAGDELGTLKEEIVLSGEVAAEDFYVWYGSDEQSLTKNPSATVTLLLVTGDGEVVDAYSYDSQKESRAWAWLGVNEEGEEDWQLTYALTPGAENVIQECKDASKVLNPDTGRCVTASTEEDVATDEYDPDLPAQCAGVQFSEIFTYYEDSSDEQFIELYNSTTETVTLDGCTIQYKSKTISLSGEIPADGYLARYVPEVTLTKNPSKSNELKLVDVNGTVQDTLTYYNGQKKGVAYAQFDYLWTGEENWQQTYAPTPGEPNVYQQYKTCAEGKVINEDTGNCVNASSTSELAACPEGKYRNPLTNRCKSITSSTSELTPCAEGYERNPTTNRCRKVVSNDGADYGFLLDTSEGDTNFIAFGIIGAVGAVGTGYVTWQFRREIGKGWRWLVGKLRPGK